MRRPRIRFTLRRMMVIVAVCGVLMAALAWLGKWLDDIIPPQTPEAWARKWAATHAAEFDGPDGFGRDAGTYHQDMAKRYTVLAEAFKTLKAGMHESTYNGPFTDILQPGETVLVQIEAPTKDPGPISAGTHGVVISDGARDSDDCSDMRTIEIRILDGPSMGQVVHIQRIYLCRKPSP